MIATGRPSTQQLLIREWSAAIGSGTFDVRFPYAGKRVSVAAAAIRQDASAAVDAAFGACWQAAPAQRSAIVNRAADLLAERGRQPAEHMTEEIGAVYGWGAFNIELASNTLRETAAQAYNLVGGMIPSGVPGELAIGVRAPAGVGFGRFGGRAALEQSTGLRWITVQQLPRACSVD